MFAAISHANIVPPMNTKLEQRIAAIERRLALVETKPADASPAWLRNAGWAANDPIYDAAMQLGARWRARENRKPSRGARRR